MSSTYRIKDRDGLEAAEVVATGLETLIVRAVNNHEETAGRRFWLFRRKHMAPEAKRGRKGMLDLLKKSPACGGTPTDAEFAGEI
jgi:hypothetical protein